MKSRRALSTVVGTVFAIIALTSTVTYISYSMGILNNYNQSVLTKNQQLSDVNKEKFQISSVTVPNNKLNITVVNTGSLPINFTKIWIQNTTTTDWVRSYVPTHNFVAPGSVLTNIGQNSGVYINPANSYNIKIVTSRGNTQQFTMNSANSAPLNIQLIALPPNVPSGFSSQLVMTVTNNGSATLTNLVPVLNAIGSPTATCTVNPVNPSKYYTLTPGSTAIFSWSVKIMGTQDGQTCSYQAQLQNGYPNNVASATITMSVVTLSATNYATNAGVLTINYTSFKWAQANSWNTGWQFTHGNTGFAITLANNNQTSGGYKLWVSENSQLFFQAAGGTAAPTSFYIVNSVNLNPGGASVSKYNPDYNTSIANRGGTTTMYFGSAKQGSTSQGNTIQNLGAGEYVGFIVIYGKYAINQGDAGSQYAQTIPFVAVIAT